MNEFKPTPMPVEIRAPLDLEGLPLAHIRERDEEDAKVTVAHVAPGAGESVAVAGVAGWYGAGAAPEKGRKAMGGAQGDTFFTTSVDGHAVDGVGDLHGPGITATRTETAAQRARRIGGIDFETKLVPAARADGGSVDVSRYYVVRKDTGDALGLIGRVAAQGGKQLDPAPELLQPAALDALDALGDLFVVDRGGCIGGSVPWVQGRALDHVMPNGDTLRIRPISSSR